MCSGDNSPISSIANSVTNTVSNVGKQLSRGNVIPALTSGVGLAAGGPVGGVVGGYLGLPGDQKQPDAPGVDPGLSSTLAAQQQNAQEFRQNLGSNEQKAYGDLAAAGNQQLTQNLKSQTASDNQRGMLYGGVHEGNMQGQRNNAALTLAKGRENINDTYQNAANQMDAAAVSTGQMVQQSQQAVQDQIYNQALQNMLRQNQSFNSILGAGGMAAGMALA